MTNNPLSTRAPSESKESLMEPNSAELLNGFYNQPHMSPLESVMVSIYDSIVSIIACRLITRGFKNISSSMPIGDRPSMMQRHMRTMTITGKCMHERASIKIGCFSHCTLILRLQTVGRVRLAITTQNPFPTRHFQTPRSNNPHIRCPY